MARKDLNEYAPLDEGQEYASLTDAQIRRAEQKAKAKATLAAGGRALVTGAKMTAGGIKRYQAWAERVNKEAIERGERERIEALERQQREIERRKHAMELQREQRLLDLEERRLQMEMQREEMAFQREFGRSPPPQQHPHERDAGNLFAPPPQRGSYLSFGTPADYRASPPLDRRDIMRGSGINLFGQQPFAPQEERQSPPPARKQSPPSSKKKRSTRR